MFEKESNPEWRASAYHAHRPADDAEDRFCECDGEVQCEDDDEDPLNLVSLHTPGSGCSSGIGFAVGTPREEDRFPRGDF